MSALKMFYVTIAVALIGALIDGKPQGSSTSELTDNPMTSQCPHGDAYYQECNHCACSKVGSPGAGLCTLMACPFFKTCPPGRYLTGACGERCTCDDVTKITYCEKKGCKTDPDWVRNEPDLAHAHHNH